MDILQYLLKSSAILALFYAVYYLFMRKDTLFTAKRFFFISGFITALILPFLKVSKIIYIDAPTYDPVPFEALSFNDMTPVSTIAEAPIPFSIDWMQVLLVCYLIGVVFLAARFLTQLISLVFLFKKTPSQPRDGYKYLEVSDTISPFSFFNYIVYNPSLHSQEELQMIMAHEKIHGKQLHSIDMFLGQLITIIQWVNPFSWLYKKAVEANLEFVADAYTIPKIASKKQYQLTLVKASSSLKAPALTSPFYQSLIKKRILMLNKTTTHKRNLLKMALVLPLLAFFFLSFNVIEEIEYKEPAANTIDSLIITSETLTTEITAIKNNINESTSAFEVDFTDLKRDASGSLTQLAIKTRFANRKTFTHNVTYGGDDIQIPAIKLNVIADQLHFGDLNETTLMQVTDTGVKALTFPKKERATSSKEKMGNNPLYLINGVEIYKTGLPKDVSFEVSENIEMLYPKEAISKYGRKGKDGVYIFNGRTTFKKEAPLTNTEDEKEDSNLAATKPIFKYLITKNTTDAEFEQIKKDLKTAHNTIFEYSTTRNSSNEITSITITHSDNKGNSGNYTINDNTPIKDFTFYKTETGFGFGQAKDGERMMRQFEERRENLEERTEKRREILEEKREHLKERAEALREMKKDMKDHKRNVVQNKRQHKTISESIHIDHDGDKPIVIVNGEVYHGNINTIDPDHIATINVIKGENALVKYGENAHNGIVEVHLKNTNHSLSNRTSTNVFAISNHGHENIYITKNTTDADLVTIKNEMKEKGFDFKYKRVKRNANNEITSIKIDFNNGKGDKSAISKKSSSPIEDIMIAL